MAVLLHPTINWQGWQKVKQSRDFQLLAAKDRIRLLHQLPHSLWAWELGDAAEIDLLLEILAPSQKESD